MSSSDDERRITIQIVKNDDAFEGINRGDLLVAAEKEQQKMVMNISGNNAFYATRKRVEIDGKVGIGVGAPDVEPQGKLHVEGTIVAQGEEGHDVGPSKPAFSFNIDTDTGIYRIREDVIGVSTDGQERFRVIEDGKMGINLNGQDPIERVDVDGSVQASEQFKGNADDTESNPSYTWRDDSNTGMFRLREDAIGVSTGGKEWLRMVEDGKMAINLQEDPVERVDVDGSVQASEQFKGNADDTESNPSYTWRDDSNTGMFRADSNAIGMSTNGQERVRVAPDGKIGINILDPQEKLDIDGKLQVSDQIKGSRQGTASNPAYTWTLDTDTGIFREREDVVALSTGGNERMRIIEDGKMGVNLSGEDPIERVDVDGSVQASEQFKGNADDTESNPSYTWRDDSNTGMFRADSNAIGVSTDGLERIRISSIGNVGIDIKNPLEKLDIDGKLQVSDQIKGSTAGVAIAPAYTWSTDTDTGIYRVREDVVGLSTGGQERLRVIQDGKVGINVDDPTERVDISGSIQISEQIKGNPEDGASYPSYTWTNDSNTGLFRAESNAIGVSTAGIERVRFAPDGKIGINVQDPAEKLDIDGKLQVSDQIKGSVNGSASGPSYTWSTDTDTGLFRVKENVVGLSTGGQERLRVVEDGKLGINLLDPIERVDVSGSVQVSEQFKGQPDDGEGDPSYTWTDNSNTGMFRADANALGLSTDGIERVRVAPDGKVGINVKSPVERLDIDGKLQVSDQIKGSTAGTAAGPAYTWTSDSDTGIFRVQEDVVGLSTGGQERLRVMEDGKLGINLETPIERVDVSGSIQVSEQFKGQTDDNEINPSYTWTNDSNTGMFRAASNAIGLSTDGLERVRFAPDGNVGIDIKDPREKLDIDGKLQVSDQIKGSTAGTTTAPAYTWSSDTDTGLYRVREDVVGLSTGGQERLQVIEDGKVGINLKDPIERVDVSGSVQVSEQFKGQTEDTESNPSYTWTDNSNTGMFRAGSNAIGMSTDGTEKVRIAPDGNVGLNVKNPEEKLDIDGKLQVSDQVKGSIAGTASAPAYTWSTNTNTGIYRLREDVVGLSTGGQERFRVVEDGKMGINLQGDPIERVDVEGSVQVSEQFKGQNGDGESNPSYTWTNDSNTGMFRAGSNAIGFSTDGSEKVRFTPDGNVGINVQNPVEKLDIDGKLQVSDQVKGSSSGSASAPSYTWTGDVDTGMFRAGSDAIGFSTAGSERVRLAPDGNVGIDIQNPAEKLDIDGTLQVSDQIKGFKGGTASSPAYTWTDDTNTGLFRIREDVIGLSTSGEERLQVVEDGKVGINLKDPQERVDVQGSVQVSDQFKGQNGDGESNPSYTWTNDSNTGMFRAGSNAIGFSTDGTEKVRLAPDGNVGINVQNPAEKLDIDGKLQVSDQVKGSSSGSASAPSYTWTGDVDTGIYRENEDAIGITTGGTKRVLIGKNGEVDFSKNVNLLASIRLSDDYIITSQNDLRPSQITQSNDKIGIGRSDPQFDLDVDGDVRVVNNVTFESDLSVAGRVSASNLRATSDGTVSTPAYSWASDTDTGIYRDAEDQVAISTAGQRRLYIDPQGDLFVDKDANFMSRVEVFGKTRLHGDLIVDGDFTTVNTETKVTDQLKIENDGTNSAIVIKQLGTNRVAEFWSESNIEMKIENSGNVGIGLGNDTAPEERLHVVGNAIISGHIEGGSFTGDGSNVENLDADKMTLGILNVDRGGTGVGSHSSNKLLVGNGTGSIQSPSDLDWNGSRLEVSGDVSVTGDVTASSFIGKGGNITDLDMNNAASGVLNVDRGGTGTSSHSSDKLLVGNGTDSVKSPSNLHWDDSSSRLGINTSSPSASLDVSGDATISGMTSSDSFSGDGSNLDNLDANKMTLGILNVDRGGTGTGSHSSNKLLVGNGTSSIQSPSDLDWNGSRLEVSGDVSVTGDVTASSFIGKGGNITDLDMDNAASGVLNVDRGGTGTSSHSSDKLLVGNGTDSVKSPSNLHWDDSISRLGINTSSPASTLDVDGQIRGDRIRMRSGSSGAASYSWEDDSDTGMYRISGGTIGFATNGSERARLDSSGRLGVGVTPDDSARLHVDGSIRIIDGDLLGACNLYTKAEINDLIDDVEDNLAEGLFWDDEKEFLGVGTTEPQAKLHVDGGVLAIGEIDASSFKGDGSNLDNLDADNISLGVLSVSRGGTGASSLSSNKLLVGNGSSSVQSPSALDWNGSRLDIDGDIEFSGQLSGDVPYGNLTGHISIDTGDGLSGGGSISSSRTLSVDSSVVRTSRSIDTGDGLNGGGSLDSDRTLSVDSSVVRTSGSQTIGGTKTFTSDLVAEADLSLSGTMTSGTVPYSRLSDHPSIDAGDGLSGGGTFSSSRTLSVDSSVVRTSGSQTIEGSKTFSDALTVTGTDSTFMLDLNTDSSSTDSIARIISRRFAGIRIQGDRANASGEPGGAYIELMQDGSRLHGLLSTVQIAGEDGRGNSYSGTVNNSCLLATAANRSDPLHIGTGGSVRITVTGSGNVGIGTTSPSDALDISGDMRFSGTLNSGEVPYSRLSGHPSVNAGDGLSGGGTLSSSRTLDVDSSVVRTSRSIDAGDGLSGGGSLSSDRTLSVDSSVVRTGRSIDAGDGLSGGGSLSSDRTLSVDGSVLRTSGTQSIDGSLGIGTSSPDEALHVTENVRIQGVTRLGSGSASSPAYTFESDSDMGMFRVTGDVLGFSTGGQERVRVASNGFVGINSSSPTEMLYVDGNTFVTGEITAASDRRLKTNLTPLKDPLDRVRMLKGYTFNRTDWRHMGESVKEDTSFMGFVAQDVLEVIPEVVKYDKQNDIYSLNYAQIVVILSEALKELTDKHQSQQEKIISLEGRLEALERKCSI